MQAEGISGRAARVPGAKIRARQRITALKQHLVADDESPTQHALVPSAWLSKATGVPEDNFGLHNHLLSEMSVPADYLEEPMRVFSKRVTTRGVATNQASSGRFIDIVVLTGTDLCRTLLGAGFLLP
jgi:hypothetical protein